MSVGEAAIGGWAGRGQVNLRVETNFYRGSKPVPLTSAGVWTGGISDCMVVCAAHYDTSRWAHFRFQHVGIIRNCIRSGGLPCAGGAAMRSSGQGLAGLCRRGPRASKRPSIYYRLSHSFTPFVSIKTPAKPIIFAEFAFLSKLKRGSQASPEISVFAEISTCF
jgi:hypothetical protein